MVSILLEHSFFRCYCCYKTFYLFLLETYWVIPGNKELLAEAIYSVITQLTSDVIHLNTHVAVFLHALQEALGTRQLKSTHDSVAVKVVSNIYTSVYFPCEA